MYNLTNVVEQNLIPIEWKGQRVITTAQLAEVYEIDVNNIQANYARNKENFVQVKHFIFLQGQELKEFKRLLTDCQYPITDELKYTSQLYLWTRQGASRHCKILDTPKAWEQFDRLEECYYRQTKNQFILPTTYKEALLKLVEEEEEKERLQLEVKIRDQKLSELEPKATYYDLVLQCPDLLSISKISKDYGKSAQWLNSMLHDLGIQYNQGGVWLLYQYHADKGYTCTKTHVTTDSKGNPHSKPHTYWTQKGRLFLYDILKNNGILPIMEMETV